VTGAEAEDEGFISATESKRTLLKPEIRPLLALWELREPMPLR
jgi:hypothetical protein